MRLAIALALSILLPRAAFAACTVNAECKGSRQCVEGVCVEHSGTCSADVDCPGEDVCSAGMCTARELTRRPSVEYPSFIAGIGGVIGGVFVGSLGTAAAATYDTDKDTSGSLGSLSALAVIGGVPALFWYNRSEGGGSVGWEVVSGVAYATAIGAFAYTIAIDDESSAKTGAFVASSAGTISLLAMAAAGFDNYGTQRRLREGMSSVAPRFQMVRDNSGGMVPTAGVGFSW